MSDKAKLEGNYISDWLLSEENDEIGSYSRDNITVALNQTLVTGSIVGLNVDGDYAEYDNIATAAGHPEHVPVVAGIIVNAITTDGTTKGRAVIVARQARIAPSFLTWKTGLQDIDKTNGLADLKALGVITASEA